MEPLQGWEYNPKKHVKSMCGYVGLVNQGNNDVTLSYIVFCGIIIVMLIFRVAAFISIISIY